MFCAIAGFLNFRFSAMPVTHSPFILGRFQECYSINLGFLWLLFLQ
jgi:hypothetical protein